MFNLNQLVMPSSTIIVEISDIIEYASHGIGQVDDVRNWQYQTYVIGKLNETGKNGDIQTYQFVIVFVTLTVLYLRVKN